jgi:hypothetical protein
VTRTPFIANASEQTVLLAAQLLYWLPAGNSLDPALAHNRGV